MSSEHIGYIADIQRNAAPMSLAGRKKEQLALQNNNNSSANNGNSLNANEK